MRDIGKVKIQVQLNCKENIFFFRNGSAAISDRNRMTGQSSLATVMATLCLQCVFKMAMSIQNPTKCEVHAVIQFRQAKGETAAEIHRKFVSGYGEGVMNRQNVAKWCHEFEAGRSDVHDEMRSGGPSFVTDENIHVDRRLTIDELHQQCSEVSGTVPHEIVTKRLGYRKLCTRWVLKMLTDSHKKSRVALVQAFLAHYEDQSDDFLDCIVMGEETWVYHHTPENKQHLVQWHHTH
jgi:hypothetical protein